MQFNRFIFDNYLATPKGKLSRILLKIRLFFCELTTQKFYTRLSDKNILPVLKSKEDISEIVEEIKKNISSELSWRDEITHIQYYSLSFYFLFPKFFFPYFFEEQFPKLQNICNEFNITLPPLPSKLKYIVN